jgi:putative AdoMet-dependent methyltransferase
VTGDEVQSTAFDSWAESYDREVREWGPGFPFGGYVRVLQTVVDLSAASAGMSILDLGAGTGNLSRLFSELGCELWCLDFSDPMLDQLAAKPPSARRGRADVRGAWPRPFRRGYDRIVSAYAFHHFPLHEKVELVSRLLSERLLPGGRLVVGDLAFADARAEEEVRRMAGDDWDEEHYWLVDKALPAFRHAGMGGAFVRITDFAGVFSFTKEER